MVRRKATPERPSLPQCRPQLCATNVVRFPRSPPEGGQAAFHRIRDLCHGVSGPAAFGI